MPEEKEEVGLSEEEGEGEEAPDEESEKPAKKGGLVKLVVAVVVIMAALIGGWFVGQMLLSGGEPAAPVQDDEDGEPVQEVDLFDPENPPGVIEFSQPFLIRLNREEGVLQSDVYLKLNMTLEVADDEVQGEMEGNPAVMSRISDTVISFYANKFPYQVRAPNWEKLKEDLAREINSRFPERYHVNRINFREFLTQPR